MKTSLFLSVSSESLHSGASMNSGLLFWLRWVFKAAHRFSLVAASQDYSLGEMNGLFLAEPEL